MKRPRSCNALFSALGLCILLMLVTTARHIFTGTTVILNRGDVLTVPLLMVGEEHKQVINTTSQKTAGSSSSAAGAKDEVTIVSEVRVTRHVRFKDDATPSSEVANKSSTPPSTDDSPKGVTQAPAANSSSTPTSTDSPTKAVLTTTANKSSTLTSTDDASLIDVVNADVTVSEEKTVETVARTSSNHSASNETMVASSDDDDEDDEQERLFEDDLAINVRLNPDDQEQKTNKLSGESVDPIQGIENDKEEASLSNKGDGSESNDTDVGRVDPAMSDDGKLNTLSSNDTTPESSKLGGNASAGDILVETTDEKNDTASGASLNSSTIETNATRAEHNSSTSISSENVTIPSSKGYGKDGSSKVNETEIATKVSLNIVNVSEPTNATDSSLNSTIVTESNATTSEEHSNVTVLSPSIDATGSTLSKSSVNSTKVDDANTTDAINGNINTTNATVPPTKFQKGTDDEIAIFYNAFLGGATRHRRRAEALIRVQMGSVNSSDHLNGRVHLYYSYISRKNEDNLTICEYFPEGKCTELLRLKKGDERDTLQNLWSYCNEVSEDSMVMYLHDKGAYHWTSENHWLRAMHTQTLVSHDTCTKGVETTQCNVCSARFSPMPHYHTSGNMWTAKCGYIKKLIEPVLFADRMQALVDKYVWKNNDTLKEWFPQCFDPAVLAIPNTNDEPCPRQWSVGLGRFASEHWVHSHPTVIPCDGVPKHLGVNGTTFKWAYDNLPSNSRWVPELHLGPRLSLEEFKNPGEIPNILQPITKWNKLDGRLLEWSFLYDEAPPYESWIWRYYHNGRSLRKKLLKEPAAKKV